MKKGTRWGAVVSANEQCRVQACPLFKRWHRGKLFPLSSERPEAKLWPPWRWYSAVTAQSTCDHQWENDMRHSSSMWEWMLRSPWKCILQHIPWHPAVCSGEEMAWTIDPPSGSGHWGAHGSASFAKHQETQACQTSGEKWEVQRCPLIWGCFSKQKVVLKQKLTLF